MLISAEIRWFWRQPPPGLEAWFREARGALGAAASEAPRVDEYLVDPGQAELGIKRRGWAPDLEIKGLIAHAFAHLDAPPFAGPVELWGKWRSEGIEMPQGRAIAVEKRRWLRRFDLTGGRPAEVSGEGWEQPVSDLGSRSGCNVELTHVALQGTGVWWTLGFEAFGSLASLAQDLSAVAQVMASRKPPELPGGVRLSYPAWLARQGVIDPSGGRA